MSKKKDIDSKPVEGKAFDLTLFKRVFQYSKPYRLAFWLTVSASILLSVVSPLRPLLIQYTLDNHVVEPNAAMLLKMTLLLIGVIMVEGVLMFLYAFWANWVGQSIIKDIRVELYQHILSLRLKYFDQTPIGALVTRAVSDIETIADSFSSGIIVIIGDLLKVFVIIGILFYIDIGLAIVTLSTIPLLLLATYIFKNGIKSAFQEVRTQVSKLNTFVQEHITGMNIVQIFNKQEEEMKKFTDINELHKKAHIRSVWYYSIFFPVVEILLSVSLGLMVWWGGRGVLSEDITHGHIVAFIMFLYMLYRPIRQLADRFNTLQMGMVGSSRVFAVLDTKERIEDQGTVNKDDVNGNISFKNVWFAYNDEDWVLKDVSFEVKQGETVALVGATGAGKSSVVNLLSRFYALNKGEILLDGVDIHDYSLASLRKNIAVVLQDVFLFSDTIANNITIHNPEISKAAIIEAAKIVGAHDFISKLPGDYDYDVKERGGMLSVGQRQLIAFIRAYVYQPKVLILDEATSSIDVESERLIQYATDKLTAGRTSIVVAHRLATIQKADRIIVLDKGEIIEMGSHQELLDKGGQYKKLYELQFKNDEINV